MDMDMKTVMVATGIMENMEMSDSLLEAENIPEKDRRATKTGKEK